MSKKTTKKKSGRKKSRKPRRNYHDYLVVPTTAHVRQGDYFSSPGSAFLKYTIEAKDAIEFCKNKFPKNNSGGLTIASKDSLQHLITAVLPTMMGHFETFQRHLFAGAFDYSIHLKGFDVEPFLKKVSPSLTVDLNRLAAYRGQGASSIGMVLADALGGWHNPERVNKYFSAFFKDYRLFSNQHCENLKIIWQLRHSIVHTGGTLTLPDAQKSKHLSSLGKTQIAFEEGFVWQTSRKMHKLVKSSVEGFGEKFKKNLKEEVTSNDKSKIDDFFKVNSSVPSFFR